MEYVQRELKAAGLFGRQAVMLSMTIDPETDSAAALAEYARQYGADPAGWRFLRESEEKTKPVLKAYDEWTKKLPKGEMDHPARVYLIDLERQHPRDLQPGLLQREAGADRHPGVGRRGRARRRALARGPEEGATRAPSDAGASPHPHLPLEGEGAHPGSPGRSCASFGACQASIRGCRYDPANIAAVSDLGPVRPCKVSRCRSGCCCCSACSPRGPRSSTSCCPRCAGSCAAASRRCCRSWARGCNSSSRRSSWRGARC